MKNKIIKKFIFPMIGFVPMAGIAGEGTFIPPGTYINSSIEMINGSKIELRLVKFNEPKTGFEKAANLLAGCMVEGDINSHIIAERKQIAINKLTCDGEAKEIKAFLVGSDKKNGIFQSQLATGSSATVVLIYSIM